MKPIDTSWKYNLEIPERDQSYLASKSKLWTLFVILSK